MQKLIQDSTKRLLKHRSKLCLSFFVPATSKEIFRQSFIRLWNEAWTVAEGRYSIQEMEEVFAKISLSRIHDNIETGFDTLCIFASKTSVYFMYFDMKIEPRAVVDGSFFVKPIVQSISGDDQYWLLEVADTEYRLSVASLSGNIEYATAPRLGQGKKASPELKSMVKVLNSDRRAWFIAGPVELVNEARWELSQAKIKRPPLAHLLHSDPAKVHEAAREVIRIQQRCEVERLGSEMSSAKVRPLQTDRLDTEDLKRRGFSTLLIDDWGTIQYRRGALRNLESRQDVEELQIDDLVEEALENHFKVVPISSLQERLGTRIAVLKGARR